jgi:hypothetical protein
MTNPCFYMVAHVCVHWLLLLIVSYDTLLSNILDFDVFDVP